MSKRTILLNSTSGLVQTLVTSVLTFVSVPIFINKLGMEFYGVFAVLSVVGNLNLLANLGLNSSLIVFISKQGKSKESDYDVVVSFVTMLFVLSFFFLGALYFEKSIVSVLLGIPDRYYLISVHLFRYMLAANSILFLGQIMSAILDAHQKIYITNLLQFLYSVLYWSGLIGVVWFGLGLEYIGFIILISASIWFLFTLFFAAKVWGALNISGIKSNWNRIFRKNVSYGAKIYSAGLISFAFEPLSKILLSGFIGVHAVAYFDISIKIKSQISAIFGKIFQPLFPYIAAQQNESNLSLLLNDITKKILLFIVPLVVLVLFTFQYILSVWIGGNDVDSLTFFIASITVAFLFFSPSIFPVYIYLMASNKADKCFRIQLVAVIINALVFLISYRLIDSYSIVLSNALAFAGSFVVGLYYQKKYLAFNVFNELSFFLYVVLLSVIELIVCFAVSYYLPQSFLLLPIYLVVVSAVFILFLKYTRVIGVDDIDRYLGFNLRLKKIVGFVLLSKKDTKLK